MVVILAEITQGYNKKGTDVARSSEPGGLGRESS